MVWVWPGRLIYLTLETKFLLVFGKYEKNQNQIMKGFTLHIVEYSSACKESGGKSENKGLDKQPGLFAPEFKALGGSIMERLLLNLCYVLDAHPQLHLMVSYKEACDLLNQGWNFSLCALDLRMQYPDS